jgi:mycothiol synthase
MSTTTTALHVSRAAITPESHALQLALRDWPDMDRDSLLRSVTETPNELTSPLILIEAKRGAILAGAVIAQCLPGKAALVWAPQLVEPQPLVTSSTLMDELCRELGSRDVVLAQALLHPESLLDAEHLQAGGFALLADLLYLQASSEVFPVAEPTYPFELQSVPSIDEGLLIDTIERTYVGTMDCPRLDGSRLTCDVVDGYRAIGAHRPELWLVARLSGKAIGCLLLADHLEQNHYELVYMGLTPDARGRGFSQPLVRAAQWLARRAGRDRLVLAVDAANRPALKLYEATGFKAFDQRSVYWKQLRSVA